LHGRFARLRAHLRVTPNSGNAALDKMTEKTAMPFTRRHLFQVTSAGAALGSLIEAVPALGAPSEPTAQTGHAAKIVNLDDRVSWAQQLEHNLAPVVLMSTFLVAPEDVDSFLDGFKKQFAIMRRQPGLISAQLHRGIAGSCLFMNYIVWESVDHFKRGFDLPEFQVQLKEYPASTVVSATFFQRVAIPGMCVREGTAAAQ
jgi:heme-degrading monooxygenase HmoA